MELNDFLGRFKEQFVDAEEITLTADCKFRNIESYDSLTGMAILVMIKDKFNIDIPEEEYKNLHTVCQVYNYILSHQK